MGISRCLHSVSSQHFERKVSSKGRGPSWWNDACKTAAVEVSQAHGAERRRLSANLRMTIREAKRAWFESLIEDPDVNIWDLAKWRHGRRSPWIPPILGTSGISSDPTEMADTFCERFFNFPHPDISETDLPGTPLPTRPFTELTLQEITSALANTSNKSAPGPSGIGYKLIKWAIKAHPTLILYLF